MGEVIYLERDPRLRNRDSTSKNPVVPAPLGIAILVNCLVVAVIAAAVLYVAFELGQLIVRLSF